MQTAISIRHLGKEYRIGADGVSGYRTLRETITDTARGSLRLASRMASSALGRRHNRANATASEFWALKDVSFDVKRGEMVGIIGRNGAGKSTLLKILSRITAPTTGKVTLHGQLSSLLEVGTGFHPELTGRENIFLNGAIMGMTRKEIQRRFKDIVAFAEIEQFIDTPVKRYSSGMYVRLAYAVAANMSPDILLIDEVLSVGDLAFQRKCMEHARRLRDRNATVMVVSHNMFAVKAMCDRAICLAHGQVEFDGEPEEAIERYDKCSRMDVLPWAQRVVGTDPEKCPIYATGLEILDESGEPRTIFTFGERIRLRIHLRARQSIPDPNLVLCFMRSDNVACCNYSTAVDGFALPSGEGDHVVEMLTPPLRLVAELYMIHVLVWDRSFQRLYTAQMGNTFHVKHDLFSTSFGVFHEPASWALA